MATTTVSWMARCAFAAALLLVACRLAAVWLGEGLQLPATMAGDGSLYGLNRYVSGPTPDIVLVGSSLTYRLNAAYFASPSLENLALAGGAPVTGLAIVANQRDLPKIILVESNILSRPADEALIERYAKGASEYPLFLRPIRALVAAGENLAHAPKSRDQLREELDRLLAQPPSAFDNSVYVARVLREQDEDPTAAVRANVERMKQLIAMVEQKGTRVLLFELPELPEVERARAVAITHAIVHAAFPNNDRWLHVDVPGDELRWADGFHLDRRSAVIFARAMDTAIAALGRGRNPG
jgi:hypothetical protein